jgi:two-component system response regulator
MVYGVVPDRVHARGGYFLAEVRRRVGDVMENLSVLLAEDNADDEMLTLWVLRRAGFSRVTVVRNGQEALAVLLGDSPDSGDLALPDLVLMDLKMPRVGGIDLLRQLRSDERPKQLDIIVLTSSEDPQDHISCYELGVRAILSKPLTTGTIQATLRNIPGFRDR